MVKSPYSEHFRKDCLPAVLEEEGGKVDNPKDPGGRTNKGVTQRTYNGWRRDHGLKVRDVYLIEDWEVEAIYGDNYWKPVKGDAIPRGVGYFTFDSAVNSGVSRGSKWLQIALGMRGKQVDGNVGPHTVLAALKASPVAVIQKMAVIRTGFLKGLKTWATFGRGWTKRVNRVEARAVAMAYKAQGSNVSASMHNEAMKAEDIAKSQSKAAAATATAGAGTGATTTLDPTLITNLSPAVIFGVIAVVLFVAFLVYRRSRINRDRAKAYLLEASHH